MPCELVRLEIGDKVVVKGLRQRMLVTDLDPPNPRNVTCAWRDQDGHHEHLYARGSLILIKRAMA